MTGPRTARLASRPRWRRRLTVRARLAGSAWRRSLRLRVALTTIAAGAVALLVLGALLTDQVRNGIFDHRRDQVLTDAANRTASAAKTFQDASWSTAQDVQQLVNGVMQGLRESPAGGEGALLLRSPDSTGSFSIYEIVVPDDRSLVQLISPELREEARGQDKQVWQSIALPGPNGSRVPGIAVGSVVTLPGADRYELYFIYSLAADQGTLSLLQSVLVIGAVALVALLLLMTWYLIRQVLAPVQQAAKVAGELSDGELDVRMTVRGNDELAQLARSFNEMAENLQEQISQLGHLSAMQQRFVSDVSHELRTPLTTIRMAAEMLHASREEFEPGQRRAAELLRDQVDRFETLLADLLEISRFDAGAAELDAEDLDLRDVATQVVELTRPLAADRGSALQLHLPPRPVPAEMDARRVERVLRNLVVNAIEHGEGKPIEIRVAGDARAAAVVVRDHGIGMTSVQAEHVFDRFWRADPARTRTLGGTGLGLAISLEDARLHGGTLEAWGSPGEGAAFRLTLPRRAGMTVEGSPLALRPPRIQVVLPAAVDPAGPSALPPGLSGHADGEG